MILDYLLAEEGSVCGKLNVSNCYLKIDGNGEGVKQITSETGKLAHVPSELGKTGILTCFPGFSGAPG